jgi:hypothetical protein
MYLLKNSKINGGWELEKGGFVDYAFDKSYKGGESTTQYQRMTMNDKGEINIQKFETLDALESSRPKTEEKGEWDQTCFVAGTKVLMADGSKKNIEDIKEGDKILSVEMKTMTIEPDVVSKIPTNTKKYRIIHAEFSNGVTNKFSPAHPYWVVGKGWCVYDTEEAKKELRFSVNALEEGDVVLSHVKGELIKVKIVSLVDVKEEIEMFNVEFVRKNNTFFANGILVHNKYSTLIEHEVKAVNNYLIKNLGK